MPRPMRDRLMARARQHCQYNMHREVDAVGEVHEDGVECNKKQLAASFQLVLKGLEQRHAAQSSVGVGFAAEAELPQDGLELAVDRAIELDFSAADFEATDRHQIQRLAHGNAEVRWAGSVGAVTVAEDVAGVARRPAVCLVPGNSALHQ